MSQLNRWGLDEALNYFPAAKTLQEITGSEEFYERCKEANERSRYLDIVWEASLADAALVDPKCTLLNMYLARQTARIMRSLNSDAGLIDAVSEAVRTVFFALTDQYRPGVIDAAGHLRTWGFEAFLAARVQGQTFGAIRKRLREAPPVDETYAIASVAPVGSKPLSADVLGILQRVLPNVLSTDWKREAYRKMVYRGATAAEISRRSDRKAADFHRFIITPRSRAAKCVWRVVKMAAKKPNVTFQGKPLGDGGQREPPGIVSDGVRRSHDYVRAERRRQRARRCRSTRRGCASC